MHSSPTGAIESMPRSPVCPVFPQPSIPSLLRGFFEQLSVLERTICDQAHHLRSSTYKHVIKHTHVIWQHISFPYKQNLLYIFVTYVLGGTLEARNLSVLHCLPSKSSFVLLAFISDVQIYLYSQQHKSLFIQRCKSTRSNPQGINFVKN